MESSVLLTSLNDEPRRNNEVDRHASRRHPGDGLDVPGQQPPHSGRDAGTHPGDRAQAQLSSESVRLDADADSPAGKAIEGSAGARARLRAKNGKWLARSS